MTFPSRRLMTKALTAVAGATFLLGGLSAMAQDVKKAKLGHSFSDSHPRAVAMKQFAADVAKATGGKVLVEVYGNASLGSEDKMLIAVQSGTQDLYMGALAPISARKKELQIFDFPFLFASDAEAGIFAMSYLDPADHPVWKQELRAGRADPGFAAGAASDLRLRRFCPAASTLRWAARCMARSSAFGPSGGSGCSWRVAPATATISGSVSPSSSRQRWTCSRDGQPCHQPGRAVASRPSAESTSPKN